MDKFLVTLMASAAILIFAVLFALPTQILWNTALEPAIEGVNKVGFFQAMGINILAGILFGSSNSTQNTSN